MKNKIRTILAVLLIAMLTLTGCSLGRFGKPSVVSLTKDAMANMKKVKPSITACHLARHLQMRKWK